MNRAAFRRFEFFDVDTISEDISQALGCTPTCAVAEGGMLIFGDENGNIILADRDFHVNDRRHKVFKGKVRGLAYILDPHKSNRQYIIAIGEDSRSDSSMQMGQLYTIKVFATTDLSRPMYVLNATVSDAYMTAFAVQHDGNEIAVGYSTGKVLLFLGQFLKDSSSKQTPPPITLLERHSHSIAALHFCDSPSKSDNTSVRLFVTMETKQTSMESEDELIGKMLDEDDVDSAGIVCFDTSYTYNAAKAALALSTLQDPKALDSRGASALCTTFMRNTSELILARQEAVCAYTVDDRAGAMAIPGEKLCLSSVGRYALVVNIEEKGAASAGPLGAPAKSKRPTVTIYDLKHKIICGTFKRYYLPAGTAVNFVLHDGGVAYVITSSWALIRFREKDTTKKIEVLLGQVDPPLYTLAITVAMEEQLEAQEIMKLYKAYGDHLYSKHDYDSAIVQFCSTVGYLPSSYVITRYLDPYRIHNLILYLEKLKDKSMATADHLTLLLSCYCKLKAETSVNALLDHMCAQAGKLADSLAGKARLVDAPRAIKLLLAAGFVDQALRVAVYFHQPAAYVQIQLAHRMSVPHDDLLGYLVYVFVAFGGEEVLKVLGLCARELLAERDKAFTHLVGMLCSGEVLGYVQALFNTNTASAKPFAGPAAGANGALPSEVGKALGAIANMAPHAFPGSATLNPLCPSQCTVFFLDDSANLLAFLEAVVMKAVGKQRLFPPKIWHTLLELYMQAIQVLRHPHGHAAHAASAPAGASAASMEGSILHILDGPTATYSLSHVLLLCHIYDFSEGVLYLLEKSNNVYLLLDMYLQQQSSHSLFKLLRKLNNQHPEVFIKVLTFFVRKSAGAGAVVGGAGDGGDSDDDLKSERGDGDVDEEDESKWDAIMDLLDLIEKEAILAPAQVLNILALNPKLPLRVVSQYISSAFREVTEGLASVEGEVSEALRQLESAASSATAQQELQAKPKVPEKRRGGYDDYDDDEDDDDEDTRRKNEENDKNKWMEIRKSHATRAHQHEEFFRDLENSTDGFSTVANYYGLTVISYSA